MRIPRHTRSLQMPEGTQAPVDPPSKPDCRDCDGNTVLRVHSYWDPVNDEPVKMVEPHDYEIECPRCSGTGDEPAPEPDPDLQRDLARDRDDGHE